MSTPPSKDASVVQTTQKQLEELDALIQKMLELPVSQLDEDPFDDLPAIPAMPTAAPTTQARPRPTATTSTTTAELPEEAATGEYVPEVAPPPAQKSAPASKQVDPDANKNRERLEAQWARHAETPPAPEPAKPKPMARLVARLPKLPSDAHLLPLLWPNRAFDQMALRCGRPGAWLRSRPGRQVLGWAGVALIAAAAAWAILDWIAWNW